MGNWQRQLQDGDKLQHSDSDAVVFDGELFNGVMLVWCGRWVNLLMLKKGCLVMCFMTEMMVMVEAAIVKGVCGGWGLIWL